jgi:rSAM/selenodomain-associated transferase 1
VALDCTLNLFARAPQSGRVKTRLWPLLGPEGAAALYRAFLEDASRAYLDVEAWESVLSAEPDPDDPELARLFPPPWRREAQEEGDLGERLSGAFSRSFDRGSSFVLAVGSDHPALPRRSLSAAFAALRDGSDAAIIPAEDGGYCAIALSRRLDAEKVFARIPWSSSSVLDVTRERLREEGASVLLFPAFYDVDRPDDLRRLVSDLAQRDPSDADFPRATARALRQLKLEAAS